MIQVALNERLIPFFYGIVVTEAVQDYKKGKPKKNQLKDFLIWKRELRNEGIDPEGITFDEWKQSLVEEDDTIKDTMMVYYLCYSTACKMKGESAMSYDEFVQEIDQNYSENLKSLSEGLVKLSGTQTDTTEKN